MTHYRNLVAIAQRKINVAFIFVGSLNVHKFSDNLLLLGNPFNLSYYHPLRTPLGYNLPSISYSLISQNSIGNP